MLDLDRARSRIADAERLVSFTGAGLSAESGIPTFRDPQSGYWSKFDPMQLASPEGFARDPDLVIRWYSERRRAMAAAKPNPAHQALGRHPSIVNVTQNIDDLLDRAGAKRVIRLHGTAMKDRCHARCGYEEHVDLAKPPGVRDCPECGAPMRPDVVWFGEMLPMDAFGEAERACAACDVLLVIGTSAVVYPAAGLIHVARQTGASIIVVNTHPSEASHLADMELIGPAGEIVPRIL